MAFSNHKHLPIAIIGGGLGGLALAIGLLRHGVKVHIYEASSAFSEIGAGVTFGANATTALGLIDPRLLEGFMKHVTFNSDIERASLFMSLRWGMDERRPDGHKAGDFAHHVLDHGRPGVPQSHLGGRIHRARLLDEMVALLPDGITSFSKSFEAVEELDNDILNIRFSDGTTAFASALIGCDGIRSKTRDIICGPHIQATYSSECAYRSMVPGPEATEALGAELAFNSQLYCGYGGYIVTYPVDHGAHVNMVAIPRDDNSGTTSSSTWNQDEWTVPTSINEIRTKFPNWYPPLIGLISRHHLPSKWALFTLQHASPYYKNRMCLMGDSAHATTPHLGAGAGMAMEDAYILSHLIAFVGRTENIEKAFFAYDAVRRPRTQECIKRSKEASLAYGFLLPNVQDDMEKVQEKLEASFDWLWHVDLEVQLQGAKELLKM
jgi:salicylate hydroxylase